MHQSPEWYKKRISECIISLNKNPRHPEFIRRRRIYYEKKLMEVEENGQTTLKWYVEEVIQTTNISNCRFFK